ncbi:MAG: hypothetical protein ACTSRG_13980, partial [Candidatus Helarchaeota archaeon]
MRRKNKLLIPSLMFLFIVSAATPYISKFLPSFTGYSHSFIDSLFLPQIPSDVYNIYDVPNDDYSTPLGSSGLGTSSYTGIGDYLRILETGYTTNTTLQPIYLSSNQPVNASIQVPANWEGYKLQTSVYDIVENSCVNDYGWIYSYTGNNGTNHNSQTTITRPNGGPADNNTVEMYYSVNSNPYGNDDNRADNRYSWNDATDNWANGNYPAGYTQNGDRYGDQTNYDSIYSSQFYGPTGWGIEWYDNDGTDSSDEWFYSEYGNEGTDGDIYDELYVEICGPKGLASNPSYGGNIWDQGTYIYWTNPISLNRPQIQSAVLKYDYKLIGSTGYPINVMVAIINDGTTDHIIDQHNFAVTTMGSWQSMTVYIDPSVFGTGPNYDFTLKLGIQNIGYVAHGGLIYVGAWFDNVKLFVQSTTKPEQVDLKMNVDGDGAGNLTIANDGNNGINITTPASNWQNGSNILGLNTIFYTNVTPFALETSTHKPISMKVDQTIYGFANRQSYYEFAKTNNGTYYSAEQGKDVDWEFYHYAQPPKPPNPQSDMTDFKFNSTIPTDWNITQVLDPESPPVDITSSLIGGNPGDGRWEVPNSVAAQFGYFKFLATSPNYLENIYLQDGSNNDRTEYVVGDIIRIKADFRNEPLINYPSTVANLSIFDPDGNLWYTTTKACNLLGQTLTFDDISFTGANSTGGNYTVKIWWDNSTSGQQNALEAGYIQGVFAIVHHTDINIEFPNKDNYLIDTTIPIKIGYNDTDSNVLIPSADVYYHWSDPFSAWQTSPTNIAGTAGIYEGISTPNFPAAGLYTLSLNASKFGYNRTLLDMNISILVDTILWYTDVPVVPYGRNTTATIYLQNSSGDWISTGVEITVNGSDYTENVDFWISQPTAGTYDILMNTTDWTVGTYYLNISAGKAYHYNYSVMVPVTIRNITADFTYIPPGQVHWSDTVNASITLYYQDLDNGQGITNAYINLTSWTDSGGVDYKFVRNTNYTVVEIGSGEYKFEVKMDNLTDVSPNNKYTFNFSASKPNYNTRELYNVNMTIVPTTTKLDSPEFPSSIIPQGPYNISIEYWDLDNVILINNNTPGNPVEIKYQWDNSTLQANSVLKPAVDGDYWELEIDTTGFDLNTKYNLTINATKNHYAFAEMNITISLRKQIAVIGITYPEATVWGENVSFYVSYTDQFGNSLINDATVNLYYDNGGSWDPFPAGWWYRTIENSSDFSTIGNDTRIYLNTSALNLPDSGYHTLNVTVSSSNYDTRYATLRMYVRDIDAQLFYETPSIERYGDNSSFHITYRDAFHDTLINSSKTRIYVDLDPSTSTIDGGTHTNWTRDSAQGNYLVTINTTYWGTAGTFSIKVWANWSGAPYYENVSVQFLFTVRNGSTEILYIPTGSIAWGFNITSLKIQFHDTDSDSYPNITSPDATVYINGSTTWYESITGPDGNNYYTIGNIYTENLNIGNHYLNVTIVKNHYDPAERIIPITIRRHNTELLFVPPGQIPWGTNVSIQIWYHDLDTNTYPIMNITNSLELSISGSNIAYASASRTGDYYWINDIKMDNRALGTYYLNITVTNSSDLFDTATGNCTLTVRNVSTSLTYTPPGIIPYSATENATFDILFQDEFGVGIDSASIDLILLYENGNPTSIVYVYNTNWTYYYQGSGTYTIHVDISNLQADNTKYTFKIDVNKSNYVSQSLPAVNMTIRSTYTRLSSPQAPSAIVPLGDYNITIYYEDREQGVRINNGTSPPYVNMTYTWDNATMQARSQLIQVGTTDTYWELNINTTGFDISITYNLTITANKTYYEHQELNISIQLRRNQPIMGITSPESTVWGENVTFNVTYTTLEGAYIPNVQIDMDWYKGSTPYFTYTDLFPLTGEKVYNVSLDTSAKALPSAGYYWVEVNCSESSGKYETLSQSFKLNIRAIDTQILYQAPQITPYRDNVTFTIEYRDTFHDQAIDDDNVTIIVDLDPSTGGMQGAGYYNWSRASPNYAITINSTYWSQAGTYPITIYSYWDNGAFPNEPYYANTSVEIDFTIRNRSAQISYTPIGSIPWGENVSLTIDYFDIDSSSYIAIDSNSSVSLSIGGTPVSFDYVIETTSWTITNINTSKLAIGDYVIRVTITKDNYSDTSQDVPLTIRAHSTEVLYIPPETLPWGYNISQLQIWFHDTDNTTNYPAITATNIEINATGENLAFGSLTKSGNSYYINDINVSWITITGTYSLNITVVSPNTNYLNSTAIVQFEVRTHRTEILYAPPDKIPWGYNLSVNIQFHDLDNTTNYPSLIASQIKINETGENLSFTLTGAPPTYTLDEINVSWVITQGTHYLNVSITPDTTRYNVAQATIPFIVRAHTSELLYTPPGKTPWNDNTTLVVQFKDTDLNNYPLIDMNDSNVLQLNGTFFAHGPVIKSGNSYTINDIYTEWMDVGIYVLNMTVVNSSYDPRTIFVTLEIRPRLVSLTGLRPNPTPFGNNVTFNIRLEDIDDPSEPGLNFSDFNIQIKLLNSTSHDWLALGLATWSYGATEGDYVLELDTYYLSGIGEFDFTIEFNYLLQQHYENSTLDIVITTQYRNTLITYDSPVTSYYGDNVTINLYYWDLDNESGQVGIEGANVDVFQPGVYDNSTTSTYQIIINTSEFITDNRLSIHKVNVSIKWGNVKPHYSNSSINISIICRKIETYREVYIEKGVIEGESVSGYPWGEPGVNITIEFIGYEGIYNGIPINNSNIAIELPDPYNNPANYKIFGTNAAGIWIESNNSKSGIFKLWLNGSVPDNNIPYRFNITLYNSTVADEPYKNQSFSFMISFRKPVTNLILFY